MAFSAYCVVDYAALCWDFDRVRGRGALHWVFFFLARLEQWSFNVAWDVLPLERTIDFEIGEMDSRRPTWTQVKALIVYYSEVTPSISNG